MYERGQLMDFGPLKVLLPPAVVNFIPKQLRDSVKTGSICTALPGFGEAKIPVDDPKKSAVRERCRRSHIHKRESSTFIHNTAMRSIRLSLLLSLLAPFFAVLAQPAPQMNLPRTTLGIGMYQIQVQVATTQEQQATGLMFRADMPSHEGMLFVFGAPSKQCFWMKNTLINLTAAFVSDDGTIVNTEDMQAQTTVSHCSAKPVRFVLEVNQGWFAKKGIKSGMKITGVPFTSSH